jgi:hypothetical protein
MIWGDIQILPGTGRWQSEGLTEGSEGRLAHCDGRMGFDPSDSGSAAATSPFRGGSSS